MKRFVQTVVEGALGLVALYVVGAVAYKAGQDMARAECRYEALLEAQKEKPQEPEPPKEAGQIALAPKPRPVRIRGGGLGGLLSRGGSVVRNLLAHPDEHRLEAYVDGGALTVNVKRKEDSR